METLIPALHFVNLCAAALVAGGQVYVLQVIVPTKRVFAPRTSVEVHNAMLGHQTDRYMKPSGIVSALTAIAILLLGRGELPVLTTLSMLIGFLGTLGVVVTSRFHNVRTNAMMEKWSLDAIPENYPEVRAGWDRVHTLRATSGVIAFVGYLLGALSH